jgi:hypothetical protein
MMESTSAFDNRDDIAMKKADRQSLLYSVLMKIVDQC